MSHTSGRPAAEQEGKTTGTARSAETERGTGEGLGAQSSSQGREGGTGLRHPWEQLEFKEGQEEQPGL